jgi:superfamily II DNA or RNA helicase
VILRDYQQAAIDRARNALANGARAICLVCPTGGGKTVIGSDIVRRTVERGGRALWLAHRTELVDQAAGTLERLGLRVGAIAAGSQRPPNPYAPVQVASIQTLLARAEARPRATVVVFDECHHAASDTYSTLLGAYSDSVRIGLTATPERGDGRGLGNMFDRLLVVARIRELTDAGALVPCEIIRPASMLRPGQIAQRPVDAYLAHASSRSAIVFSPSLVVAAQHTEEFRALGISAQMVDQGTPAGERRAALERFRAGELRVLVNVQVLTEGTDLPRASAAILARGCGTAGLYLQMAGRILRPHESKQDALLIDLRGVSYQHGHPADDRTYSLDGRGIRRENEAGSDQQYCRVCGAPVAPGVPCAECGTAARTAKPLVVTGAALVRYERKRAEGPEERARTLARWIREGRERDFKPGWAFAKFRAVYGNWPEPSVKIAAQRMVQVAA